MIYLDNGATSFPKPQEVADAVYEYMTKVGSNINRGGYEKAYSAAEVVLETREMIDSMMNGYGARNAIFTPGNTHALILNYTVFLKLVQWSIDCIVLHVASEESVSCSS